MKLNLKQFSARSYTLFMSVLMTVALTACGGGNGSAGSPISGGGTGTGGGTVVTKGSIVLSLADSTGAATTTIPAGGNLTATAKLVNASGAVVSGAVVTFSVSNSAGVLNPALGTALSDSNGVAQITLSPGTSSGAATLTASSVVDNGTSVTASVGFNNGSGGAVASNSPVLNLVLLDSAGNPSSSVSTSNPLTAKATILDGTGKPMPNIVVTFSNTASLTKLTPSAGTIVTDANGVASIRLDPVDLATAQAQAGAAGSVFATATASGLTLSGTANYTLGASTVTLSLKVIAPATSPTTLSAYGSTSIQIGVYDANNVIYTAAPVVVNFSSGCATTGKAMMPASATTINGIAGVTYTDNACSASDVVSATVAGVTIPATTTLNVIAPIAASINFVSAAPSDKSIVIAGAGGNGRTETALLTFKVVDINGVGLKGQTVTFTNNFPTIAQLNTPNAISQDDGTVVATVNSLTIPGTFRIDATLGNGLTSLSDTIVVTTGQPIQAAFSLSAGTYNIEGWDYDNTITTLQALIADTNGNPVADGTPVVVTTDSGAVGTSNLGGCTTTNGGCTVPFRSQDPRFGIGNTANKRAGMATVTFNSSNSTTTALTGTLDVFLSGSQVMHVYSLNNGAVTDVTSGATFVDAGCSAISINLEIEDLNFNPMPSGSTITTANANNMTVGSSIFPATVPSIGAHGTLYPASFATRQGGSHVLQLIPDTTLCHPAGAGHAFGSFDFVVTTPKGIGTVFTFLLQYPT